MRLMLSASAFSSWFCCVLSEPGGEGGAGGSGTASSIASGFSASGTSLDAELAPLFFPFFEESPKNAARGTRATCSPALRPHEIFMQGIGAARDEWIRVASATRDEALGVLTRKPPPYTRRTSSSAFSRTARLIDFRFFETLQCATALPQPSLPTPRHMSAVPCASFASAWTRVRARRPPSRRPARVYPPGVPDWKPPEEDPKTPSTPWEYPPSSPPREFVVPREPGISEPPPEAPAPPRIEGDPLRPYEPRPTRDLPPPVSDPERTEGPEEPAEPEEVSFPAVAPEPEKPEPNLAPPDPPGWLPPEETSDPRERDGVREEEETWEKGGGEEWRPRGSPGVGDASLGTSAKDRR